LIETLTSLPLSRSQQHSRVSRRDRGLSVSSQEGGATNLHNNNTSGQAANTNSDDGVNYIQGKSNDTTIASSPAAASSSSGGKTTTVAKGSCICGVVSLLECVATVGGAQAERATRRVLRSKHREFNTRAQAAWGRGSGGVGGGGGSASSSKQQRNNEKLLRSGGGIGGGSSSSRKVVTTTSTLCLVDLAGSESVRLTRAKGVRQKEGGKINQSLLTLSRVLEKLGDKEYSSGGGHINYRDSKLTRILKPSLSGNARMGAICCITPAVQYSEETKSTLDFATRTMLVTTNAESNVVVEQGDTLVAEFEKEMERIKLETAQAEDRRMQMEKSFHKAQDEIKMLKLQLQREREAAEKEKEDTLWELMSITRRNKDLEENMQTTLRATELNKQAMELVRRQAKELEKENQEFETRLKELTRRNKQLEQTNLDLKQNMEVTSNATLLNKQSMEILTKQVKDLERENESYRVKVEDLTIRNEGLMRINTDLKQNMQNTVSATTLNRQASDSMRMQVKELEKKNGAYVVQIGALNRRNKDLENNAEAAARTIEEMQQTINELNLQNQQLGERLEMYTNKSKQRQQNASEQRRSFEGKVHQMMGRIREEVEELSLSPKVSFD